MLRRCSFGRRRTKQRRGGAASLDERAAPTGNTPTAMALQQAREYYARLADEVPDRYLLLATDGLPSCTLSGTLSPSQPDDVEAGISDACQDALVQVQALSSDGIKVVVLAVGAEPDDDTEGPPECLEQMAQAAEPQSLPGQGTIRRPAPRSCSKPSRGCSAAWSRPHVRSS